VNPDSPAGLEQVIERYDDAWNGTRGGQLGLLADA
jgi:hypothetical protein